MERSKQFIGRQTSVRETIIGQNNNAVFNRTPKNLHFNTSVHKYYTVQTEKSWYKVSLRIKTALSTFHQH